MKLLQVTAPYSSFSMLDFKMTNWRNYRNNLTTCMKLHSLIDKCKQGFAAQKKDVQGAFDTLIFKRDEPEIHTVRDIATALAPFCSSIVTDKPYYSTSSIVTSSPIGLGSSDTWHGSPDMRLQAKGLGDATNMLVSKDGIVPSGAVYVEGKVNIDTKHNRIRSQVVGTAVVASFTNYTEPMTPVILMCKRKMCVCLYHCTSDIQIRFHLMKLVWHYYGVYLITGTWPIINMCPHTFMLCTLYRSFVREVSLPKDYPSKIGSRRR